MDVGVLAFVDAGEIVFVDVAEDPDLRKIGDGEKVGGIVERLHARRGGDVLLDDDAGNRGEDIDCGGRMIDVAAQHVDVFGGGFDIHAGLVFGGLRDLEILLGNSAMIEEKLGTVQLGAGQSFVGDGLAVIRGGSGNIGALHAQQELALGNLVAETRMNLDDTARGQRNDRDVAGDVGGNQAGDCQFRHGVVLRCGGQRKLLGVIHFHQ